MITQISGAKPGTDPTKSGSRSLFSPISTMLQSFTEDTVMFW